VGSIKSDNTKSAFSNDGEALEFYAPGEQIYSSLAGEKTAQVTGTSFAAPQVTGALALAMSDTAATNKGDLEVKLIQSAKPIGNGYGVISTTGLLRSLPDFVARKALFLVGSSPSALSSSDKAVKDRLESLGYTVTVKYHKDANKDHTNGMNLLVISSSVRASDVSSEYEDVQVPVLTWEAEIYKDMKMTNSNSGDFGFASNLTQISLTNTAHPLAAALTGWQSVFQGNSQVAWGKPSSAAFKVASLTADTSKSALFGYDKGSAMIGKSAPDRRIGFFMNDTTALTAQGWQLFDAAVTWAVTGN
jgi:subtilisin family serine protease